MKKAILMMVMVMLLLANKTEAGGSVVVNSSFEYDERVINPITEENTPERWDDVNIPEDLFGGYVYDGGWSTDGYYSLTLFSRPYKTFASGDMAMISQRVYLADVNEISFDLKLEAYPSSQVWDPSKRSALVLIDDIVVWDSDNLEPNESGEYIDVFVDVNGYENSHKLSLGIKADTNESSIIEYLARWDIVRFDAHCWGDGYLRADLTGPDGRRDCYVDEFDLKLLAENWLEENPAYRYDLFEDGIVNFPDYTIFADNWLRNSYGQEDELLVADLNNDGVVNLLDFAIAAEKHGHGQPDFDDISILAEQWLQKNWLYWPE